MKIFRNILILISVFLFWKCANQLPPSGGEVDKIPPKIIETNPLNETTNFHGKSIEFTFSEYIDKNSIYDAIFISPGVEGGIDYDWSGKTLTLNFNDSLKKNMTYIITVGTNLADLNNRNKMKSAFNLTFSTGNKIDKGRINGKVYTNAPTGVMMFAYVLDSNFVNPAKEKPNYVSQIGLDGDYSIAGLANGNYLVFAVKDEFKDLLYTIGQDKYGVPNRIITLTDKDSIVSNFDFMLTREDTLKPNISDVIMPDNNHLMIKFSKFIDSAKVSAKNFFIFDSTNRKRYNVEYFYKGKAGIKNYFISFSDSLVPEDDNYLIAFDIYDLFGNMADSLSNSFVVNTKPDTTAPSIINVGTDFKKNQTDYDGVKITFNFDDGINIKDIKTFIKLFDSKNNSLPFLIKKNNDASFALVPKINLYPRSDYSVKFVLNNIEDAAGNKVDSTYIYKFSTISDLFFSGISGKVINNNSQFPTIIKLKPVSKNPQIYTQKINADKNDFDFKRVLPGKYILWGFIDKDSSGTYSYGKMFPFEPSEKFVFYPDTLNLRARWPVGDVFLNFEQSNIKTLTN